MTSANAGMHRLMGVNGSTLARRCSSGRAVVTCPADEVAIAQQQQRVGIVGFAGEGLIQVADGRPDAPARVVDPAAQLQGRGRARLKRQHLRSAPVRLLQWPLTQIDAGLAILQVRDPERGVQRRAVALDAQCLIQQLHRAVNRVAPPAPALLPRPQIQLVGSHTADAARGEPLFIAGSQMNLEGRYDAAGQLLLHRKYVAHVALKTVGPAMRIANSVDELGRYPQPRSEAAHASL